MALIDNILAYYKLDENTGTTANDATGNGFTGTFNGSGTKWAPGIINSGGSFNGTDNRVDVLNFSNNLVGQTAFSLNLWFKPSDITTNGFGGLAGLRDGDIDDCFYILQLSNSANIEMRFRNSLGVVATISPTNVLTVGTWVMLTLVYNGTSLAAYVNASAQTPQTISGTFLNNGEEFCIGREGGASGNWAVGTIDEVGFWLRALSSSEVTQLYNGGAGLQYPFNLTPVMTFSGFSFKD